MTKPRTAALNNRITAIRHDRRLRQYELAGIAGINPGRLSAIENGRVRPKYHEKEAIADALVLSVHDVFPPRRRRLARGRKPQERS